ncbi:hypothetical protein V2J09_009862, partial [Rumex salicifolius]
TINNGRNFLACESLFLPPLFHGFAAGGGRRNFLVRLDHRLLARSSCFLFHAATPFAGDRRCLAPLHMDLEKYASKYSNVSSEELKKIRDTWCGEIIESVFESTVRYLHKDRNRIKKYGRASLQTQPLVQMLSVSVQPKKENLDKPFAIYGRIHAEICDSTVMIVHELYNRESNVAEILGTSKTLTLSGPDFSSRRLHEFTSSSMLSVMLFDGDDNVFAKEYFYLADTETKDDYEDVKCKVIHCEQGFLTLRYIVIPFGVHCRIEVCIYNRQPYEEHDFVNLNGKVSVRYANTYGHCVGEECVLFEKQGNDFERVEYHRNRSSLQLSRCWVALPAYSSMVIDVDLSEFETRRKVANETIELLPLQASGSADSFIQGDIVTSVHVALFSPRPFGRCSSSSSQTEITTEKMETKGGNSTEEVEEMDTDGEDECSHDESDDSSSSNLKLPWSLRPHKGGLWPYPAVEIFSVFVGREKDEEDALVLAEHVKVLPILDGSRLFEHFISLGMKFDIKDVKGRSAIKGYVEWDPDVLDSDIWHEKQICSLVRVGAQLKVYCHLKAGCTDEYPKIYGSLVTQYSCYDYSTRYNRDYYRIVLLKRTRDDSVEPSIDWKIPLSRSMVVVPSYSSLIVNVDLSVEMSGEILACVGAAEIRISEGNKIIETADFSLRVEAVGWQFRFHVAAAAAAGRLLEFRLVFILF